MYWKSEMGGTCSMHIEMRNAYKILVRKLEGTRHKCKGNIRVDLR
jgi:hypothetical protein